MRPPPMLRAVALTTATITTLAVFRSAFLTSISVLESRGAQMSNPEPALARRVPAVGDESFLSSSVAETVSGGGSTSDIPTSVSGTSTGGSSLTSSTTVTLPPTSTSSVGSSYSSTSTPYTSTSTTMTSTTLIDTSSSSSSASDPISTSITWTDTSLTFSSTIEITLTTSFTWTEPTFTLTSTSTSFTDSFTSTSTTTSQTDDVTTFTTTIPTTTSGSETPTTSPTSGTETLTTSSTSTTIPDTVTSSATSDSDTASHTASDSSTATSLTEDPSQTSSTDTASPTTTASESSAQTPSGASSTATPETSPGESSTVVPLPSQSPSSPPTRVPSPDATTSSARPSSPPDETGIVFSQSGASSSGSPLPSVAASDGSGGFWHNPGAVAGVFIPLAFALGGLVFFIGKYLNNRKQNARTTPYQAVGNGSGADMEQGAFLPAAAPLSPFYYDPYNDHPSQQQPTAQNEPWQRYTDDPQPLQRSDTVFSNPSVYSQDGTMTSPTDPVMGHGGMQGVGAHGGGGQGVSMDGLMNSTPGGGGGGPSQGTAPNMGGPMPTAPNATVGGQGGVFNAPSSANPAYGVSPYLPVIVPPLGYLSTHLEESEPESDEEEFAGSGPALPIRNRRRFDENSCIDEPARARLLQNQGGEP